MLVLSRKIGEEIVIGDNIRIKVLAVDGGKVRIGIVAPKNVTVDRQEVYDRRMEFVNDWSDPTSCQPVSVCS